MAPFCHFSSYSMMGSLSIPCHGRSMKLTFRNFAHLLGNGYRPLSAPFFLSCGSDLSNCCKEYFCKTQYLIRCDRSVASSKINCSTNNGQNDCRMEDKTNNKKRFNFQDFLGNLGSVLRKNSKRVSLLASISFALGLCFLFLKLTTMPAPKAVAYSEFITNIQCGKVSDVLFEEGSPRVLYNKKHEDADSLKRVQDSLESPGMVKSALSGVVGRTKSEATPEWKYSTRMINHDEAFLLNLMREKGTSYSSAPQSVLVSLRNSLITLLTLWIPLTPLMWLLHRQFSSSNSPTKKRRPTNQNVSFQDVEGVDAAKLELLEIVLCLHGTIDFGKLGARLPKGILLVGPPGTGKTLLARAVAVEAGVPFFSVSASEFVELFVGRGAARIRDLFNVARKSAPSVIFIDELDAVGGKRGRSFNDERDQTLNQLLTEMDGFESDTKVIVIAATNRPEALDPALCRPGRFSRRVVVGEPDLDGRKKILHVHVRDVPLEENPELVCSLIASLTPGFVGADLANIVNEAALLAARRGGETVSREDVMMAVERAKYGINEQRVTPATVSKGLGKLFPWMPSLARRDTGDAGWEGLKGYQTLV